MMTDTSLFFTTRPAYPWSVYPLGLPALGGVALLLVLFTVWTYFGHPQTTRRRLFVITASKYLMWPKQSQPNSRLFAHWPIPYSPASKAFFLFCVGAGSP